jgi:hypothetical protein
MQKKLTITVDEAVYEGLHRVIGKGNISKFLEGLARPHVTGSDLGKQYREAARDLKRERAAKEWCEGLTSGVNQAR